LAICWDKKTLTIKFDESFPEAGALIGFGQRAIRTESESRTEDSLQTAMANEQARFHIFLGSKVLVRKDDAPTTTFLCNEAQAFDVQFEEAVLLGADDTGPRLAVPSSFDVESLVPPYTTYDMRALLYSSAISDIEASTVAQAASLLHWQRMNRYCGLCGQKTTSRIGGYRRECKNCNTSQFPRTDPVVIMLAIRGDYCLLGRSAHFPPGWFSTLAGFVEPGETIEAAVRRETYEESGIELRRVRYHTSQPWPFPHSLMIGAFGEAISEEIRFDANELEDCRWFSRDDVRKMIDDNHEAGFKCPPTKAIAHSLIRKWVQASDD
jgi:NAD+ diphosphatase